MALVVGAAGIAHNGIFRGKNLGTIHNLNEYLSFRHDHGIDDHYYKDLYIGDYFTINDGTYNAEWQVAHFDYYTHKGDRSSGNSRGVLLISKYPISSVVMKDPSSTEGGYIASAAHTTVCPAVATALSTVLGSYLLSNRLLLTNTFDENILSNCGGGQMGATIGWAWYDVQCAFPGEIQIFGSTIFSSSYRDTGEANLKLALFDFIGPWEYGQGAFWLRDIAHSKYYSFASSRGYVTDLQSSQNQSMRPLIYIG